MTALALLRKPEFYLGVIGLSVALWFAFRAAEETSPGLLSAVHAQVPELIAEAGCVACHGDGIAGVAGNAACLACHESIQEQFDGERGLHSFEAAQGLCGTCHAEHQGSVFRPVNDISFQRLGIRNLLHYDHNGLDFKLVGDHQNLKCSLCHEHAQALVLEPGQQRFLGLRQDCVACHKDEHEGSMGSDCASCHGQEGEWSVVPFFEHTERFDLAGVHADSACAACHGGDLGPDVTFLAENTPEGVRACAACHDSPHSEPFALAATGGCVDCHSTEHPGFDRVEEAAVRPLHDKTEFALLGPHVEMACDDCHGPDNFPEVGERDSQGALARALSFEQRHPGRSECAQCHADPHGDSFGRGSLADAIQGRAGCVRCHSEAALTWDLVQDFEHVVATGFDLVGAHKSADCTDCHNAAGGRRLGALVFPGRGESCSSCHEDPHSVQARGSVAAHLRGLAFREEDCHRCHNQKDFREVLNFDHALSGWPLVGAHQSIECTDCHAPIGESRLGPARGLGAAPQVHCSECHEDPHGQRFNEVGMPQVVAGREGCARCHAQVSFRELPGDRFDHGLWTAFELLGSHRQVRCTECHGVDAGGDMLLGKFESLARADPRAAEVPCEACHQPPHGESFQSSDMPQEIGGQVGCSRCHGDLSFRETPRFKHVFTGFALEGVHAELSCVACHGALVGAANTPRSGLARLLPAAGRSCTACHNDSHGGQFLGRPDPSCGACHTDSTSFLLPQYDHAKTRFPLDEVHESLACAACHVSSTLVGGEKIVRYRPLGITCVDCHGSAQGGPK
ncbi:MAG: hypothetical protein ACI87O_001122 [Planctomycetota bacterium]|jgi:hypothetical protein